MKENSQRMTGREHEIIHQYEKDERFLSKSFVDSIPWNDVKNHELSEKFIPVLVYMRDVEAFTDVYYQELMRTPTGRDPLIKRFMDRWWEEEKLHAELIDRFLNEAGIPTSEKWFEQARQKIPKSYTRSSKINSMLANCIGKRFSAVHMTWGAINELSTLQGYKRLWELAQHPVLEYMLKGIAREESSHIFFYHSIAKIKLAESPMAQRISRFIIEHFWSPVGQGTKPEEDTNYIVQTLFSGDGMNTVKQNINGAIQKLPGFTSTNRITNRIQQSLDGPIVSTQ